MMRIPNSFATARWLGMTPADPVTHEIGAAFTTNGGVVRIKLDEATARRLADAILRELDQRRLMLGHGGLHGG
jgi:hypothetical protein